MIDKCFRPLRKAFILAVPTILVFGCKESATVSNPPKYSFFVAGHTYGKPGVDNAGVHPPFKEKFELINNDKYIEFGVFTGDIVKNSTEQDWNEIDSDLELLDDTVYFAVGNHDVSNRPLYESRYGPTYYSFIHNSDLMVVLDPNLDKWNISGDQLEFLKTVLNDNLEEIDNIFVFFHQLIWWEEDNIYGNVMPNSLFGRADTVNFWSEVEPLFSSLPNEVYMFAGDVGAISNGSEFMYHNYDNITLIASGMGTEHRDNMVIVDIQNDKSVSFRLIALNGDDLSSLGNLEDYVLP
ncbi:MAG: metallophosphoesterase [Flavobacteriales bacterium]|nr:metallophosphoesterase [Flavobacteriales bacterium]